MYGEGLPAPPYASWLAVLTYKIRRKAVGMIIKSAVAIKPRILTSIFYHKGIGLHPLQHQPARGLMRKKSIPLHKRGVLTGRVVKERTHCR